MAKKELLLADLSELRALAMREHYYCDEDCWFSCPKSADGSCNQYAGDDCNCGADSTNKKIEELYDKITKQL